MGGGGVEALLGGLVRQMLGTNLLVLEFQASVKKPFIDLSVLWKVSAHVVSTSYLGHVLTSSSHCLFTDNCTVDRHSASADTIQPIFQLWFSFPHCFLPFTSCFHLSGAFRSH